MAVPAVKRPTDRFPMRKWQLQGGVRRGYGVSSRSEVHHYRHLEAIETYEKALKQWPENGDLKYGLRRAKIHFGIERRYTDLSFENRLLRLPRDGRRSSLFNDVLEHVRSVILCRRDGCDLIRGPRHRELLRQSRR